MSDRHQDPVSLLARWMSAAATPSILAIICWLGLQVWEDVKSTKTAVLQVIAKTEHLEQKNTFQDQRIDRVERLLERRSELPSGVN